VASGQVLIVSADERWLRVLEVTLRLGGAETISRHSVGEALRITPLDGQQPTAIVVDLGAQASANELAEARGLVRDNALPAVVILPEGLVTERERLVAIGATVLIRPYRPSDLYAALWPGETVGLGAAGGGDESLTVDTKPEDGQVSLDHATATDEPASSADG
jgi:DNA-binding response OmpR family regulator